MHAFMNRLDTPVDIGDAITFSLLDGAIASVSGVGIIRPGHAEQHVHYYHGTGGSIVYDLVAGKVDWHAADGTIQSMHLTPTEVCPSPQPVRSFVDLIAGLGVNLAPGVPAVRTVEALEAAHLSATSAREIESMRSDVTWSTDMCTCSVRPLPGTHERPARRSPRSERPPCVTC